jgi:tripartite-type tricarboxylate transporter receptor subunit TctC
MLATAIARREMLKRLALIGGAALGLPQAGCSPKANRQTPCPQLHGRQVRWLVPFPPGGGYDIYSRLLEPHYERQTGAEIIIENSPGAGGIISANKLRQSPPDGLTLGILNAPGLLVAALSGAANVPNPARDFTILGRLVRNQAVWVTSANSPLHSLEELLAQAQRRPIVFGMSEVGSTTFTGVAVATHLLGIDTAYISGFAGSRETSLAVMRGEVELASFTFESVLDRLESRELRVLLQISAKPIAAHGLLDGVPQLCGAQGITARRAAQLGRDPQQSDEDALALTRLTGAGLLVAAPPNLPPELSGCLEQSLYEALNDAELQAAAARARRSLDVGRADEALSDIRGAAQQAERFLPILQAAIGKIRA